MAALFARFGDIYGNLWTSRFATAQAADRAIAEWARQLKGITPDEIRRGLDSLPDKPPSAPEFKGLCRRYATAAHRPFAKALPAPMDRETGMRALGSLRMALSKRKF